MAQSAEMERLLTNVLVNCAGADKQNAQAVFFDVLRDFCFYTNAWQYDADVSVQVNVRSYSLTIPTGSAVVRMLNLYESSDPDKRTVAPYAMPSPPALQLGMTPTAAADWVATLALQPLDPVNSDGDPQNWPAFILQKYGDTLQAGVLGRLMAQAAKPFTNTTLALFHMRSYKSGRANAMREVRMLNTGDVQVWRYPGNFAPGGRQYGA